MLSLLVVVVSSLFIAVDVVVFVDVVVNIVVVGKWLWLSW